MSEIPIKIQLQLEETPSDIEARLAAIDKELEKKPGALKQMGTATRTTSSLLKSYSINVEGAIESQAKLGDVLADFRTKQIENIALMNKYASGQKLTRSEMKKLNRVVTEMARGHVALSNINRRIGQELFWLGLGSMFIVMSYARWRRSSLTIESAQLSLRRAVMSMEEAQRRASETIRMYGARSREARAAILDAEEAELSYKLAVDRVRSSIEQQNYALWTFILGAVPTVIRAVFSLTNLYLEHYAAQIQAGTGMTSLYIKSMLETKGYLIKIPILNLTIKSYWGMVAAMGAATLGLTLVLSALSYFLTEILIVNPAMEKMKSNLEGIEDSLVGHSLVNALRATRAETSELRRSFVDLGQEASRLPFKTGSPLEVRTTYGWAELAPMERLELPRAQPSVSQVNINIQGPFYIREEADISKLAAKIGRLQMSRVIRMRGRT